MQLSYQECYEKFSHSYGNFESWPSPHQYLSWFSTLSQQFQLCYLHPTNYSYLYEWVRQLTKREKDNKKQKKPSRAQKRKLKKKALQQQYGQQKKLIGKWVQKQRKDLIEGLNKIEQQEKKAKEKKKNKLTHLIQIHKEVYKHHMKKRTVVENHNKRVQNTNKKKRLSIIKKMKQIFQSRKLKVMDKITQKDKQKTTSNQRGFTSAQQETDQDQTKEQDISKQVIHQSQQQFEDVSQQQLQKQNNQKNQNKQKQSGVIPAVSFPIKQMQYNSIGKLTGKLFNQISLRQWVTNVPNSQLQQIALQLVNRLAYKQAIKKVNNPSKAKKIIVSGLKQSKRTLTTIQDNKKSKCLIVALNVQRNNLVKGVDDEIQKCINLGHQNKIPVVHVSTRSKLGRAFTGKFGPRISIISIINYEGYEDYIQQFIKSWQQSCLQYDKL